MASSGKAAPADDLPVRVRELLRTQAVTGARLCVGYSGGLDSGVLLHVLAQLRSALDFRLDAVHVHHGLSPNADAWQGHCEQVCQAMDVHLRVERVDVQRAGKGTEAAARAARYAVYARQPADFIVLAHQQDDQVETLLLNLLRGSGVRGLAAMPVARPLGSDGITLLRPLLGLTRAQLQGYALAHGLDWIEDESNQDMDLARNRLRHRVMPSLARHFPAYRAVLARTTAHMAECAQLLDDLARLDLGPGGLDEVRRTGLDLDLLPALSRVRAANLLRYCLRGLGLEPPNAASQDELLDQLLDLRAGQKHASGLLWHQGEAALRVWRNRLRLCPAMAGHEPASRLWQGEPRLDYAGGQVSFTPAVGRGLSQARLALGPVVLGPRRGGERFQPDPARPRRALKKILRESALPPWERSRLPLLFCGEELAWVAGVGVDASYQCPSGEAGWVIDWIPPSPRP
jgi:tRNA(Ile)-lysidine synthase